MKKSTEKEKMYIVRKYIKAVDVKQCKFCQKEYVLNSKYSSKQKELSNFCSRSCGAKGRAEANAWTEERRLHMRMLRLGKKHSIETRRRMSEASKRYERPKGVLRGRAWKGGISFHPRYKNMMWWKRRAMQLNAEGTHTDQEWQELKEKYAFTCLCCKNQEPFIKLTQDHIVPLSRGGTDYISNIQPLCQSCNSRKNTKVIDYTLIKEEEETSYT